eukprot:TRINITY_DN2519_c0_g1_i1.p1 TRINITY_DN2519_c0_g1~~TRINITY_DN2519_c0_g1_i1.p1  ORF type:complete len:404 (+),score=26.11 TRINITY_DN2519_c0_g1_i1:80-1213(+)
MAQPQQSAGIPSLADLGSRWRARPSPWNVPEWPACDAEARNPECFKHPFECNSCCNVAAGFTGLTRCWGGPYSYAECCPACPLLHEPGCFAQDSGLTCAECCDTRLGPRGNSSCWSVASDIFSGMSLPSSYERCCLGRTPICSPPTALVGKPFTEAPLALQTSQMGQDAFVLTRLSCLLRGFYLDIGAFDGEVISNTHAMDVNLGWRGVCVDAVYRPHRFAERSCSFVEGVVHNSTGRQVTFEAFRDHYMNSRNHIRGSDDAASLMRSLRTEEYDSRIMETVTISDVLLRLETDGVDIPLIIDYVSLDVEGLALEALQGFPFSKHCVRVWTIEVEEPNSIKSLETRRFMQGQGYVFVGYLGLFGPDLSFAHKDDCRI